MHNSAEVYPYYSLPFCQPKDVAAPENSIGEAFAGHRKQFSLYDLRFKVETQWQSMTLIIFVNFIMLGICSFKLSQDDIKTFVDSITRDYMFEMYVDGLPVKGFVGEVVHEVKHVDAHDHVNTRYYLFPHLEFSIAYNGDRVIAVNVSTDPSQRVDLAYGASVF